jgi:hypothetical protein
MSGLVATVGAGTASGTALIAGLSHLWRLARFRSELHRQRVLPSVLEWPVAVVLAAAEATLGVAGALAVVGVAGAQRWAGVTFALTAVLFTTYAAYAAYLFRRRPGVPCACGDGETVSVWTVTRAALLAAGASAAWLGGAAAPVWRLEGRAAVTVLAVLALALLVWELPAALRLPGPVSTTEPIPDGRTP